ncbi:Fidgetin-like protein 1, partial [Durusdinium trenchii]
GAADTDLDEYEKAVKREVVENLDASWDDIIGLEEVKSRLVREVVAPQVNPQLFEGARRPEKGVLLYGPPGNGKTLIAKAVASKCQATFFSISASSVVSKWVGDSEKSMRALFSLAQKMQPSVIFIDEIDSMLTARSTGEHEGARRLKTEFLKQTEGVTTSESDRVLVLGATNRPGDLDDAAMRRLPLRIYIPLPELETRKELVRNVLKSTRHCLSSAEFARLARETEGYSCSDLAALTREAAKAPFQNFTEEQLMSSTPDQVRDVSWADFQVALKRVKPSVSKATLDELKRFERRSG